MQGVSQSGSSSNPNIHAKGEIRVAAVQNQTGAHWMLDRRRLPERRLPLDRTDVPGPLPPAPAITPLRAFRFCTPRSMTSSLESSQWSIETAGGTGLPNRATGGTDAEWRCAQVGWYAMLQAADKAAEFGCTGVQPAVSLLAQLLHRQLFQLPLCLRTHDRLQFNLLTSM